MLHLNKTLFNQRNYTTNYFLPELFHRPCFNYFCANMKINGEDNKLQIFGAFAAIYIIWGTTYLAIKIGLEGFPPFLMAAIRYAFGGLLLLAYCKARGEVIFYPDTFRNVLIGAFVMTCGQAIAFWSEKYISSGLTAIFGSLLPVCYILLDTMNWDRYKKSRWTQASILLGLAGVIILFTGPSQTTTSQSSVMGIIASAVAVLACFCWAKGSLYFTYHKTAGSLFNNVGWQLIGGMLCCLPVSGFGGEWQNFELTAVTYKAWLAVIYLTLAGSIVALIALYWLLARRPAPIVGTYAYVNPVIAVILGYLIAGETIGFWQIVGMIFILIAAYLANSVKFAVV